MLVSILCFILMTCTIIGGAILKVLWESNKSFLKGVVNRLTRTAQTQPSRIINNIYLIIYNLKLSILLQEDRNCH